MIFQEDLDNFNFDASVPREHARAAYMAALNNFGDVARAIAGWMLLGFAIQNARTRISGNRNELVPLLLIRHMIESIDAVSVLLREGCSEACKPLMRSTLEASASLLYIWQDDTKCDERSLAYRVGAMMQQVKLSKKYDVATQEGKDFDKYMGNDKFWGNVKAASSEFAAYRPAREAALKEPEYAAIVTEWDVTSRRPRKGGKNPRNRVIHKYVKWYQLYDGPCSIKELCERVDLKGEYEFLYGQWSESVHAGNVMQNLGALPLPDGTKAGLILPIRLPNEIPTLTALTFFISEKMLQRLAERFDDDEHSQMGKYFVDQVQPLEHITKLMSPLVPLRWVNHDW